MLFNDELIHNYCINYKWKFDMIFRILGRFGYSECLFLEYLWITSFYKNIINVIQVNYCTSYNIFLYSFINI